MARENIQGPGYRISLELTYLPQAPLEWWKTLIRYTRDSHERPDKLKKLLDYIQSPEATEAYIRLIPSSEEDKDLYRMAHGDSCTVPSMKQIILFHKRLPKVAELLKTEIAKYERRN